VAPATTSRTDMPTTTTVVSSCMPSPTPRPPRAR
jgi:hypothetical protein